MSAEDRGSRDLAGAAAHARGLAERDGDGDPWADDWDAVADAYAEDWDTDTCGWCAGTGYTLPVGDGPICRHCDGTGDA